MQMKITVYLGSSMGKRPVFRQAATELGEWIGRTGHTLIYGGSRVGLMGVLADAVIGAGGKVIGVEPGFFVDGQVQHPGITQLIITKTMAERKQKMLELGDAFIAFPGGIGTLEEMAEMMTLVKIGQLDKPFCFLNIDGYYEPFRDFLMHMVAEGFLEGPWAKGVFFADGVKELDESGFCQ